MRACGCVCVCVRARARVCVCAWTRLVGPFNEEDEALLRQETRMKTKSRNLEWEG